jgi:hypothetical protein
MKDKNVVRRMTVEAVRKVLAKAVASNSKEDLQAAALVCERALASVSE